MPRNALTFLLLLGLAACGGSGGGGEDPGPDTGDFSAILVVTNLDDSGPGSLRDVVAGAPDNAGVVFDPDLPIGSIALLSPISISQTVTINGLSGTFERFTINGGGSHRLFEMGANADYKLALWALTLTGGFNEIGGAINASGALALRQVQMVGNHATAGDQVGGAIAFRDGHLSAEDSSFSFNSAGDGGAVAIVRATANFKRCSFYMNIATLGSGGAIHQVGGALAATNVSFLDNQAPSQTGGAIHAMSISADSVETSLYACTVVGNSASLGGGVYMELNDEPAQFETHHSILAQNAGGMDPDILLVGGPSIAGSNNVLGIGGAGSLFNGPDGNQVGDNFTPLDPELDPSEEHTVGRVVRIPSPGSPAVNVIAPADLTNNEGPILLDQRGAPRHAGGSSDAGAIER